MEFLKKGKKIDRRNNREFVRTTISRTLWINSNRRIDQRDNLTIFRESKRSAKRFDHSTFPHKRVEGKSQREPRSKWNPRNEVFAKEQKGEGGAIWGDGRGNGGSRVYRDGGSVRRRNPFGSRPCFLDESVWSLESTSLETLKALSRDIFRAKEESDIEICPRRRRWWLVPSLKKRDARARVGFEKGGRGRQEALARAW